jgi:hypothetical protein
VAESKTKVMHNQRLVDATDVPVAQSNENWSDYTLEDGTKLRVRFVVTKTLRVEGEYDSDGNPTYLVKGNIIAVPTVQEKLRKKG